MVIHFLQCHLLKRLSFPHWMIFSHLCKGLFFWLSVLLHWSIFCLYASATLVWFLYLCNKFCRQEVWDLQRFSFSTLFWLFGVLFFMYFQISLMISSLTHWLPNSALFNCHIFVDSPAFPLLMISSFIPLWSKRYFVWLQPFNICGDLFCNLTYSLSWRIFMSSW